MAAKLDDHDACSPLTCSVCLGTLKKPVTIPCGHSFCMECVRAHWDNANRAGQDVSCPLCRVTFPVRPELSKNLALCELLEYMQQTRQVAVTEAPPSSEDVLCDVCCTEEKRKAAKSCLVCMASYCTPHLQPHYRNPVFQNHQLVSAVRHIGSVCRVHLQPMEGFCKTDQICICQECESQDHKDHEVVTAEQEKAERETQKPEMLKGVENQIQELEANITKTRKAMDFIQSTASKEKEEVQKHLDEASVILERFQEEVTRFIESEEKSVLDEPEKNFRELEVRCNKLRQQKQKVEQVTSTDTISFIQQFQTLKMVAEEKCIPILTSDEQLSFTRCHQAACTVKNLLMKECRNQGDQLTRKDTEMDKQPAKSKMEYPQLVDGIQHSATSELRAFYLQYACDMELDPDTLERSLMLIGTKEVKRQSTPVSYPENQKRFAHCAQVLGKEELKCSSYWEVELLDGWASIGVCTEYLSPKGSYESTRLGRNDHSWCFCWHGKSILVCHNSEETILYKSSVTKLGVYVQWDYGNLVLTFYDVRGTRMIKYSQFCISRFNQRGKSLKIYPAFYLESVGAHLRICSWE